MNRLDIKLKDHKHPSDLTLVVKDGKEFQAHRSVLSQASSFFEKLLNSDGDDLRVSDGRYSGVYLHRQRSAIHSRKCREPDKISRLSSPLKSESFRKSESFLEENISTANCISVYYMYLAEKYLCQGLIASCRKFIHSHFSSVAESDDFLNLSSNEVEKWISSDEIVIDAEENVFDRTTMD